MLVCGVDPGASTGLAFVVAGDKPMLVHSTTIHPCNQSKFTRARLLETAVMMTLAEFKPALVVMEGARTYPHRKASTVSTIGTGENRGAVLTAIGHYVEVYKAEAVMVAAPDGRQGRGRLATKGAARIACRAWFGFNRTVKMTDDECDAAVLAVAEARERGAL